MKSTYRTCASNCSNRYTNTNTNTDYLALLILQSDPISASQSVQSSPPSSLSASSCREERRGRGRALRDGERTQIVTTCHAMLRCAVVFTICSRDASVTSLSFSHSLSSYSPDRPCRHNAICRVARRALSSSVGLLSTSIPFHATPYQ